MDDRKLSFPGKAAEKVAHFWQEHQAQSHRQYRSGCAGSRARVQVARAPLKDRFLDLFANLITEAGMGHVHILRSARLELPGYFRPATQWDLLAVHRSRVIVAVRVKSLTGPSFERSFERLTQELLAEATDFWASHKSGGFTDLSPWLGCLILAEDCPDSRKPLRRAEPHFGSFPVFEGASWLKLGEILCDRLLLRRHYNAIAYLPWRRTSAQEIVYPRPPRHLSLRQFGMELTGLPRRCGASRCHTGVLR